MIFLRTVWATLFIQALEKNLVYGGLNNKNYEADTNNARTVKIPKISGTVNVRDYTKDTDINAPDDLDDATIDLVMSNQKYFNLQVDDLDKVQSNVNVLGEYMRQAAIKVRETVDQQVANFLAEKTPATSIVEVTTAKASVTDGYIGDLLELKELVRSANIAPDTEVNMVANPQFMRILEEYLIKQGGTSEVFIPAAADDTLRNGFRGRLVGFNLHETTVIPTGTAGQKNIKANRANLMVWTRDAVTYADQVASIEPYRPEKRFADAVKGLYVYGMKEIDTAQLFSLQISTA